MKLCSSPALLVALFALAFVAGCGKGAGKSGGATTTTTVHTSAVPDRTDGPVPPQYHLNQAQPKLRTLKIWVGTQEVDAEIAANRTEIATGMMFRTNMTDGEGMLFFFALPDRREFYMKNCVVPLSAAYIDANGVVDEIVALQPGVLAPVPSRSTNIKYVLEVPQGWFQRYNVPTGVVVNTSSGPLKKLSGVLQ